MVYDGVSVSVFFGADSWHDSTCQAWSCRKASKRRLKVSRGKSGKKQWQPDTNQRNRCKAAQDFEGKSTKGRAVDSNHKHAPHAFDMKMRNSSEPSWGQKVSLKTCHQHQASWIWWQALSAASFAACEVLRALQSLVDGKLAELMWKRLYAEKFVQPSQAQPLSNLVLYAKQFFVESVGCIHTHSGAYMMIILWVLCMTLWLYDSCFEWAWSASAEIARPQLWRTGGCTLSRKDTRKRFCR